MKAVVERSIAELVLYKGRQGIAVAREQPTLHCPALSKIMYPRFWLLSGWQTRHCEGLSEGKKNKEICIKHVLIGLLDLQEIKTCHLETKTQKYALKKASLNKFKSNFALNIYACIRATAGELSLAKRKMGEINQRLMDESKTLSKGDKIAPGQ